MDEYFPKKINIAGIINEVKLEHKPQFYEASREIFEIVSGYYCSKSSQIVVDSSEEIQKRWKTLIHEIVEGINETYCLKMTHDQIEQWEFILYHLLKYNIEELKEIK